MHEIFDVCDLDGNGLLSRAEFTWFNQRTSGEDVGDVEWGVVEGGAGRGGAGRGGAEHFLIN